MIHYLRDGDNTIVDIQALSDEVHCFVVIYNYSKYLLELKEEFQGQFIDDIASISEIRGMYFEGGYVGKMSPDALAKHVCTITAKKWCLRYVTD